MTPTLAASFRALFPAITVAAALAILGASVFVWYAGYGLPLALGLLIVGGIALVACFGLVAIQIENNELLAVIAEAVADGQGASPPAAAPAARAADPLVLRSVAPPPQAPAQRSRVEPVVTARRG
jgi:hypothetical protein